MELKNYIIKKLGGYTQEEFKLNTVTTVEESDITKNAQDVKVKDLEFIPEENKVRSSTFNVHRDGQIGNRVISFEEFEDYINACGIDVDFDNPQFLLILLGASFEMDGGTMRFVLNDLIE